MLKMIGKGKRGDQDIDLIVFGLSQGNLDRLKEGRPITFPGEQIGLANVEFIIFSGETEQSMARELADLVGPETNVKIDPKVSDG